MYAPPHQLSGVLALLSVSLTRGIGASASSAALEGVNDPVAWATEIEAVEPAAAAELLPPFNEDGDEDFDNEEETTSAVGGMAKRVPLKVPNAPDICTDEMKCMNECQRKGESDSSLSQALLCFPSLSVCQGETDARTSRDV